MPKKKKEEKWLSPAYRELIFLQAVKDHIKEKKQGAIKNEVTKKKKKEDITLKIHGTIEEVLQAAFKKPKVKRKKKK